MKIFNVKCGIFAALLLCLALSLFAGGGAVEEREYNPFTPPPANVKLSADGGSGGFTVTQSDTGYSVSGGGLNLECATVAELFTHIPSGSIVNFSSVTTEGFSLSENYILSGEINISSGAMSIISGTVEMREMVLTVSDAPIRIKSGTLNMYSGRINALNNAAITLDYSASASFSLFGGSVSANAECIRSTLGSVYILGGECISSGTHAIYNTASLYTAGGTVSGAGVDVYTETPIHLTYLSHTLNNKLLVKYNRSFERGSITPVFLGATAEQVNMLTLYDANSVQFDIRYFASSGFSEEENFIAVYLPYIAKFYSGNDVRSLEFLSGEKITPPECSAVTGYNFGGWYSDYDYLQPINFNIAQNADITAIAKFTLAPPVFSISSLSFTYDKLTHNLTFDSLYHPLMADGTFSYEWYRDDTLINVSSSEVRLCNVSDTGSYKCKLSFSYMGDYISVFTPNVSVNISPAQIIPPEIQAVKYTAYHQNISLPSNSIYRVSCSGGIDAGEYPVTFTLVDCENYRFPGGNYSEYTASFKIEPADNAFLGDIIVQDAYVGSMPTVTATPLFGTPIVYYATSRSGEWSTTAPTSPGNYYVMVFVDEDKNYHALSSSAIAFRIINEECVGIGISTQPSKTDYLAFERLNLAGAEIYATYNSGRVEILNIDMLSVEYRNGSYLQASDRSAVVKYLNFTLPIELTVARRNYDLSPLVFSSQSLEYNATNRTLDVSGNIVGLDGIALQYTLRGGGRDVGSYTVELHFSTDSINYVTPPMLCETLTITPMAVSVNYENLSFIYDGGWKLPSGYITTIGGAKIPLSMSGGGINAGKYTANALTPNQNYTLINPQVDFEILKADYDLGGIYWIGDEFTYDGGTHTTQLAGLPSGVSVIGYADASAVNAGEYTASAVLAYDSENYNEIGEISHTWRILAAEYDMSGVKFVDSTYVFDGEYHTPILEGKMPVGYDGIELSYSYSTSYRDVTDGMREVIISFSTDSNNYNTPGPIRANVQITPKSIRVIWGELRFVYNGSSMLPTASADECELIVSGAGINAGNYIATCKTEDKNYYIINPQAHFVIEKCENSWTREPGILGAFVGDALRPFGEAKYGSVRFVFTSDVGGNTVIPAPTAAGNYYMCAVVDEGDNYRAMVKTGIPLSISAVLPKELIVKLTADGFIAFSRVTENDITAHYLNNNGSISDIIDFSSLSFRYNNADSFRCRDTTVEVIAGDFSQIISIKVMPAEYDMSSVSWNNTTATYDGREKQPTLSGLPDGVSVASYTLKGAVNAGVYDLSCELLYDSENYKKPSVPKGQLIINKCTVPYPILPTAVYDKQQKQFTIPDTELYIGGSVLACDSGEYKIPLTLRDPINYSFPDELSCASFIIEPREITVKICEDKKSYIVVDGSIIDGDILAEQYYETDGNVYLSAQNANYSVKVIPLKIEENENRLWIILIIILTIILLIITSYMIYLRRGDIVKLVAAKGAQNNSRSITEQAKKSEKTRINENNKKGTTETESVAKATAEQTLLSVDELYANTVISDDMARGLMKKRTRRVETTGTRKSTVNVGAISREFADGEIVDINSLKEHSLIPKDAGYVKVLGGGVIDKPLEIYADSFSLGAVKMIALTGGSSVRSRTVKKNKGKKK